MSTVVGVGFVEEGSQIYRACAVNPLFLWRAPPSIGGTPHGAPKKIVAPHSVCRFIWVCVSRKVACVSRGCLFRWSFLEKKIKHVVLQILCTRCVAARAPSRQGGSAPIFLPKSAE